MKTKLSKIDKIIWDCYTELYANSEPKADFSELVANATINSRGERVIPFDKHFIDKDLFSRIIDKHKKRVRSKMYQQMISNTIHLGCSPTFKR